MKSEGFGEEVEGEHDGHGLAHCGDLIVVKIIRISYGNWTYSNSNKCARNPDQSEHNIYTEIANNAEDRDVAISVWILQKRIEETRMQPNLREIDKSIGKLASQKDASKDVHGTNGIGVEDLK